ncbi:MAG: B12-binding domain-containing radical SAM protein [Bacteroidetes bacterium]|nr:B12-binding domain-containing radical SAM protein [Bacteroidota bacterium]
MRTLQRAVTNCLLVQTKFSAFSFWNYQDVCDIVGAKYPAAPLGLLTVAGLLPQNWTFRLVDENVEPLLDNHLLWADIVCTGGMLPQQKSILELIGRAHDLGKIIVVGGPDPTSQPALYEKADFLVLGEGEITIPMFLKDLQEGATSGTYVSEERANMLESVIPRYDLIRFRNYIMIGMQFIRGCPFNCEFCDVIELFGRTPRFKSNLQILKELQTLYDLGYRGHIDMVDDNFIGNKKKVKELLREIKAWSVERKFPFFFTTEASVNLAEDDELLQLMKECDFRYVFLGIETPENETLALNNKTQNVNRPVTEAVRKILSYGMVSNGGYIIGFDSESSRIAGNMITSIQESGIAMAMIGLLYALPNTQLTRRLEDEGRLFYATSQWVNDTDIDQMTSGLNFVTLIPRTEILNNFISVLDAVYDPVHYYRRVTYTGLKIRPKYRHKPTFSTWLIYMRSFLRVCREAGFSRATGLQYWKMFFTVILRNPMGIEAAVNLAAMFIHFQKQKAYIVAATNRSVTAMANISEQEFNKRMTECTPAAVAARVGVN